MKEVPIRAEATLRGFARALSLGDLETALAYFAPESCLLTPDATEISGRASIGAVLAQLTAARPAIGVQAGRTLAAGPIALCTQRWTIASTGAGEALRQAFDATFVVRRLEPGWQLLLAAPWGM